MGEVPQVQTQTVVRDVPKVQVQEVVRHQPVVQKQLQERVVEIPHVQTVQPVITERQVVQSYEDVSYTTNVQQGQAVSHAPTAVMASCPYSNPVYSTGAVVSGAPMTSTASYGAMASYGAP